MSRRLAIRAFGAPQLVRVFKQIAPNAYINKGRDARFIAEYMRQDAQSAIDVYYAMLLYPETGSPFDIPIFIQTTRRYGNYADVDPTMKELVVAEYVTGMKCPVAAWPYLDYRHDDVTGLERDAYEQAKLVMEQFVDSVLGARNGAG